MKSIGFTNLVSNNYNKLYLRIILLLTITLQIQSCDSPNNPDVVIGKFDDSLELADVRCQQDDNNQYYLSGMIRNKSDRNYNKIYLGVEINDTDQTHVLDTLNLTFNDLMPLEYRNFRMNVSDKLGVTSIFHGGYHRLYLYGVLSKQVSTESIVQKDQLFKFKDIAKKSHKLVSRYIGPSNKIYKNVKIFTGDIAIDPLIGVGREYALPDGSKMSINYYKDQAIDFTILLPGFAFVKSKHKGFNSPESALNYIGINAKYLTLDKILNNDLNVWRLYSGEINGVIFNQILVSKDKMPTYSTITIKLKA